MDYSGKIIRKTPVTPSQTSASGVWTLDDAAQAQRTNTWPVANVPNPISRSLRFRSSATASLTRSVTGVNTTQLTFSAWFKLSCLTSTESTLFATQNNSGNYLYIGFPSDLTLDVQIGGTANRRRTTQVFRDPSAWYHLVVTFDSTQATASDRIKVYVNGSQVTAFGTNTTGMSQNANLPAISSSLTNYIGGYNGSAGFYFDGYMTEINTVYGQALTPSSFGGTNAVTGVWEPRQYTGTYGTNGFYLNFKDNTSTTTLGYDYSGNNNTWTTNNISLTAGSTYDSMLDVPTQWIGYGNAYETTRGNYCVVNPLDTNGSSATITEANLKFANGGTAVRRGTLGLTNTKVYWEFTQSSSVGVGSEINYGSAGLVGNPTHSAFAQGATAYTDNGSNKAFWRTTTAGIVETVTPSSFTVNANDIIQVAYDGTTGKFWFGKNNTWYDGSGGTTGNPSTGSNPVFTLPDLTNPMTAVFDHAGSAYTTFLNCGQRPFSYTPPSGYLPLCTTNLSSPTILQGNQFFNAITYTGQSGTLTITSPQSTATDLVWIKDRTSARWHSLFDSTRGAYRRIFSNSTSAETNDVGYNLNSFTGTGFTLLDTDRDTNSSAGDSYVAWTWNANGGTTVSNTAGTITSTVQANTTAGFSIVTYTGTSASSATIGHGLGVKPAMIIWKCRSNAENWPVWHQSSSTNQLHLNETAAATSSWYTYYMNGTQPTSTVFSVSNDGTHGQDTFGNGRTYVAYCFAAVAGYSAFGSGVGNGTADNIFVYTGFRPKFVMFKRTDSISNWITIDGARNTYNVANSLLNPDLSDAEYTTSSIQVDFLSNGYKIRGSWAGFTNFIYAAFAETPFKNALAR